MVCQKEGSEHSVQPAPPTPDVPWSIAVGRVLNSGKEGGRSFMFTTDDFQSSLKERAPLPLTSFPSFPTKTWKPCS